MENEEIENPILGSLKAAIGAKLDPFATNRVDPRGYRLREVGSFLAQLRDLKTPVALSDVAGVVREIRSVTAGVYVGGFDLPERGRCSGEMSSREMEKLQGHLENLVTKLKTELPELLEEFPQQFS